MREIWEEFWVKGLEGKRPILELMARFGLTGWYIQMGPEKIRVNNRKASWRQRNYPVAMEVLNKVLAEGKEVTSAVHEVETLREMSPHHSIDSLTKQLLGTKGVSPIGAVTLHKKKVQDILEEAIRNRKADRGIEFVVAAPHLSPHTSTSKRKKSRT